MQRQIAEELLAAGLPCDFVIGILFHAYWGDNLAGQQFPALRARA